MATAQREAFMRRLGEIEKALLSHPYAGWIIVDDARTPPECRALAGTAWRLVGSTLRSKADQHFALGLKDCRCRLMALSVRRLTEDAATWRVMG
jgi:hypothetical protein